nr:hypothetical protein [Corynebacterium choanae]
MCRPVQCQQCGNTTWAGCGKHADQVMAQVPPAQRCTCPATTPQPNTTGLIEKLFGKTSK